MRHRVLLAAIVFSLCLRGFGQMNRPPAQLPGSTPPSSQPTPPTEMARPNSTPPGTAPASCNASCSAQLDLSWHFLSILLKPDNLNVFRAAEDKKFGAAASPEKLANRIDTIDFYLRNMVSHEPQ